MASTGFERDGGIERTMSGKENYDEKPKLDETPMAYGVNDSEANPAYDSTEKLVQDSTHRKLKPRHIQLIGIGGYVASIKLHLGTIIDDRFCMQDDRDSPFCPNWARITPWWSSIFVFGLYHLVSFLNIPLMPCPSSIKRW